MDDQKTNFRGIRNEIGRKHVAPEFFFDAVNFNNDSIVGADKILFPEEILTTDELNAGALAFKNAVLYNMELDTTRVDNGVVTQYKTIQGNSVPTHYYGTGTKNSELNTAGVNGLNCIFSMWASNVNVAKDVQYFYPAGAGDLLYVFVDGGVLKCIAQDAAGHIVYYTFAGINNPALTHYCIFFNATLKTIELYINGGRHPESGTVVSGTITSMTLINLFINRTNFGVTDNNIYDLSLLSMSALSAYTNQQIATNLYSNKFNFGKFLFVNEYRNYNSIPAQIDGLYEYTYLDEALQIQTQEIAAINGSLLKGWLTTLEYISVGRSAGLCKFVTFNDKMIMVNGKDFPLIYWGAKGKLYEMGAPCIEDYNVGGLLTGDYYYAVTYLTSVTPPTVEEVVGTVSNLIYVSGKQIKVNLPIGYSGTLQRKVYRTEANGTNLKYLTTIADNTTLTYIDNNSDAILGSGIPVIAVTSGTALVSMNTMFKPYFIKSVFGKICGCVMDKYPTQVAIGQVGIEMWDSSSDFIDVSNEASDNTAIVGMELDYNQLIVGTRKSILLVDPSASTAKVAYSRSGLGVANGYSMCRCISEGDFNGGVMFVSTENDVRLLAGYKNVIPNTVNDINTENWAQVIKGTFTSDFTSSGRVYSEFYNYKYHLICNDIKYVFDVRTKAWWKYFIMSATYLSSPSCLAIINKVLYNGQVSGAIEREYSTIQYKGEDVEAVLESPDLYVSDLYNFVRDLIFWFIPSDQTTIELEVVTNDDTINKKSSTFIIDGGVFNEDYYSNAFYDTTSVSEDYRQFHVNTFAKWVKFYIRCSIGRMFFRGYKSSVDIIANKE